MLAVAVAGNSCSEQARKLVFFGRAERRGTRGCSARGSQRSETAELVGRGGHQAHIRSRMDSAASFARGAKSPAGPMQEGQPASQAQARMSSRVFSTSNS